MATRMNEIWIVCLLAFLGVNVAVNATRVLDEVPNETLNYSILDLKQQQQSNNNNLIVHPTRVEQISWKPRAFVYRGFLSEEECDHLISIAEKELERSTVVDIGSGESLSSEVRTSSGMFIPKGKDAIISRIEEKIAVWTFLPKENGEGMQVLRYEPGEKYDPHVDFFEDKIHMRGGHRVATVLMYLTDVSKGGETVFPSAEEDTRRRISSIIKDDTLSDCAKRGIAVKPKRGDALLFFSLTPHAVPDTRSLHAGCPVIEGEKWIATKWIHVDSFDKARQSSENCVDEDPRCGEWAAYGECKNNPIYMVGSPDSLGACRKSCKVC